MWEVPRLDFDRPVLETHATRTREGPMNRWRLAVTDRVSHHGIKLARLTRIDHKLKRYQHEQIIQNVTRPVDDEVIGMYATATQGEQQVAARQQR